MNIPLKVPVLPESVADALIAKWYFEPGAYVLQDQRLVDIETDKVILEVVAPTNGILQSIVLPQGARGSSGALLGEFQESTQKTEAAPASISPKNDHVESQSSQPPAPILSPSVRQEMLKENINPNDIVKQTGRERITPEDLEQYKNQIKDTSNNTEEAPVLNREQKREPMSSLRRKIAERLMFAQQNAAILTTFNEVNMHPIFEIRQKHKEAFEAKYHVKLGLMSFFIKAVCAALEKYPIINAYIDGSDIVYQNYYDLGVAVSTERGLLVPIIRDAQNRSFAECEQELHKLALNARDGKISLADLQGGTFTITNGGVFGSLLSTPILNPPQSAILGMHKIQERPIAENNNVVIRPMMYIALSYDHRLIDGAQAVGFLVAVKNVLEEPERFFLDLV
ncbi:MAG: 2-oxoglutarate dehydrogenase complex dihydrolipoyllysine-residue succinyltransferase [Gammaproteobacteria bacterium]|nr:2-oxoglutarate dehydrogenase complex dihydrolipoyllysine-residue succinyltransferase [Gammaproteobacteria bacterium]